MSKGRLTAEFSQRMRPDTPFDFDAEVARAYRFFPELKGNTYFVDSATGRFVHPRPTKKMADRVMKHQQVRKHMKLSRKGKWSFGLIGADHTPFNVVFLYIEKDSNNLEVGPSSYSDGQAKRALFDHELGHAVTLRRRKVAQKFENAPLLRETMAENFALMRQFQRYGNHNRQIRAESRVDMTAMYYVFGGMSSENQFANDNYFCGPSLEKIIALRGRFDFASLTPRETGEFAALFALKYTPRADILKAIRDELDVDSSEYILPGLSARVLKTESTEAFKWGSKALRYVMGPEYKRRKFQEEFRKKQWPGLEKAIGKKERQIRRTV